MASEGPGYHYTWAADATGIGHPLSEFLVHNFGVAEAEAHATAAAVIHSWLLCIGLIVFALLGRMSLSAVTRQTDPKKYIPDSRLTIRNFWELLVGGLQNLLSTILEPRDAKNPFFFGLLATLFIYVLFGNLMGLVPGFAAPTGELNTNLAMAMVVLVVFNIAGLMRNGTGYITHLFGPIWWLMPLIFTVEVLSVFLVRPASLTLRLTGNMFGDHMVFGIMSDLTHLVFPTIFLGLGAFVSFIQALVFTLLSAVYIALATAHEGDHH
ncbi:MAG: F-type H+-transporting ATPase subunit a [Myxococcota bacterium]|jgi:F-type H+-transporting ATPase subunit a